VETDVIRPAIALLILFASGSSTAQQRAVIVDGRNNHNWQQTTPVLKKALEATGLFAVDVATAPPQGADMSSFRPEFSLYSVVVLNYTDFGNGGAWPEPTRTDFEKYVSSGGGVVIVHAASSAFPGWKEFNEIAGLGGWGGRDQSCGPRIYWRDGKIVRDESPGPAGHHGKEHTFQVVIRDPSHPITVGLPTVWMHAQDELYDSLRGPANNLSVLATAYSDPATGGSGQHEPVLFTIQYGKGRVFHTVLGHDVAEMRCVGFLTTFARGAEWAATGRVTQSVPRDFPTTQEVSIRP
jgi:hypothetical protein